MPTRLVAALVLAVALAGCSSPAPAPSTSTTPPTAAGETPVPTPTQSAYDPDATADENLAFFDAAVEPLTDVKNLPAGADVIDALVGAGFEESAMELTPDKTAIGLDADSIEFSVKINGQCIIGQFGSFGYRSIIAAILATDTCLVGKTVTLDD
jgi:hypothetical protein